MRGYRHLRHRIRRRCAPARTTGRSQPESQYRTPVNAVCIQARIWLACCTGKNAATPASRPHIQWTLPRLTDEAPCSSRAPTFAAGPLMDFGYETRFFPVHVKAAANAKLVPCSCTQRLTWLVCREVCIPARRSWTERKCGFRSAAGQPDSPAARSFGCLVSALPHCAAGSDTAVFSPHQRLLSRRHTASAKRSCAFSLKTKHPRQSRPNRTPTPTA